METILQKWGNSNAIRIPKVILDDLGIKTNDVLVLEEDNEKIIIHKKKQEFCLKEEFEKYNGKELLKEFEWDEPRGKELW